MIVATIAALVGAEGTPREPYNVLEWTYLGVLVGMTLIVGLFALVVVARIVEPRGVKALLRRIAGKA